jgi:LDH2 family malate/lactate/ureidoglycolate dehydrogenase
MKIAITTLREKMMASMAKHYPATDAERIVEVLLWAEMSGIHSMGLSKMIGSEPVQDQQATAPVEIVRDTKLSRLINAHHASAPLVCQYAVDVAIQKAQDHGFAIVGVNNTFTSSAALGYYVERLARADLIGIAMSRSAGVVAPFDSIDPLFGTNPLAIAVPTQGEPLTLDMSTSPMTWTGLVLAKLRGERIPEGIAIDHEGNPTTDPEAALKGALFPFDHSYKGSALGMIAEILAGPLVASAYLDYQTYDGDYGNVFMAIDPELLVDKAAFKKQTTDMVRIIKASRPRSGVREIRLPSERAHATYRQSVASGKVDVDDAVLKELGYI